MLSACCAAAAVQNQIRVSSRANPAAQAEADRDAALQKLAQAEELLAQSKRNHSFEYRRAERYKNEVSQLRQTKDEQDGIVGSIGSQQMWSKEALRLRSILARWQPDDVPELCSRAMAGMVAADGTPLLDLVGTDPRALRTAMQSIIDARDQQIYEHLKTSVLQPRKSELARLLTRMSWRKAGWLNGLFKWDWSGVDADGVRYKSRHMLAPDSKMPFPDLFDLKSMRILEARKLEGGAGNTQQEDGRGAEVKSVDWCCLHALKAAEGSSMGGMATAGTEDDPHWMMLTGDGAGLTETDSGVRVAVFCGSVRRLNQSTHGIHNLVFYRESQDAESYVTLMARTANIRSALCRLYNKGKPGELLNEDGSGTGIFVRIMLTADKPFLMKALGRKNMNHNYFSHSCDCPDEHLYSFDYDLLTHYDGITFEERCPRALVPIHEALDLSEGSETRYRYRN